MNKPIQLDAFRNRDRASAVGVVRPKVRQEIGKVEAITELVDLAKSLGTAESDQQSVFNDICQIVIGRLKALDQEHGDGFGGYKRALNYLQPQDSLNAQNFEREWRDFIERFFMRLKKRGEINLLKSKDAAAGYLLGEIITALIEEVNRGEDSIFAA